MESKYEYRHNLTTKDIQTIIADYLNITYPDEPELKPDGVYFTGSGEHIKAYTHMVRVKINEEV